MSRSMRGSKPTGFEYWSARPGNRGGGHYSTRNHAGANWQKKATHKAERREGREQATFAWDDVPPMDDESMTRRPE